MLAHQPSEQLKKSLFFKQDLWIQPMLCYVVIKTDTNDFRIDFLYNVYTVGPRLIGPIGTEDFSPLSQGFL